jgi:type VI secretion system protein ImpC
VLIQGRASLLEARIGLPTRVKLGQLEAIAMPQKFSFGNIQITADTKQSSSRGSPDPDAPFRIALLGDFSNRARSKPTEGRRAKLGPVVLDRDNFDEVLGQCYLEVELPAGVASKNIVKLRITELEDFHPDRIFTKIDAFHVLEDLRKRLSNPATFATAAAEIQALMNVEGSTVAEETRQQADPASRPSQISPDKLLDQIIDASRGQRGEVETAEVLDDWQGYLRRLVAPHVVPRAGPQQREWVARVEAAMGEQMRMILHDPAFQAAEAAWRSAYFLMQRLETDSQLRLHLVDLSKAELAADLNSSEDLKSTMLYRLLIKASGDTPESQPWALWAGNYTFDHSHEDAELLGRMAQIAAQAGVPFLAAASSGIVGCDSLAATPDPDDWLQSVDSSELEAWNALRKLPEAAHLGLALPRFLLRLPYGRDTEPIGTFPFEEFENARPAHETYLWGNPAFACVYLLAVAFSQTGWNLRPGVIREISGLPLHVYETDAEPILKPCAEVLLTQRAAERILEHGLMPLLSLQGSDVVRLARFQSLADPLKPLAGRWNG